MIVGGGIIPNIIEFTINFHVASLKLTRARPPLAWSKENSKGGASKLISCKATTPIEDQYDLENFGMSTTWRTTKVGSVVGSHDNILIDED